MTKKDFAEMLAKELSKRKEFSDLKIETQTVWKVNDTDLHGLIFREEGKDAAPVFYIDQHFEEYVSGENSLEYIANTFCLLTADMVRNALQAPPVESGENITWEGVKNDLAFRLLEIERNKKFLKDKPYREVGCGLAIVCDIIIQKESRAVVTNAVLNMLKITKEELFDAAMRCVPANEPPRLITLEGAIFGGGSADNLLDRAEGTLEDTTFMLSTKSSVYGATAIIYSGVREKILGLLGRDFYVLPSSVHEMLLMPASRSVDKKELFNMVRETNKTVVEPNEILSDNVFFVDSEGMHICSI